MDVLYPLKSDAAVAARALSDAVARHRMRLEEAEKRGAAYYHEAREARKLEAEARVQRVAYK
ncbi:MAG: hypothetical protein HY885_15775 [Deltaproteobacteria bacterium]|nr:hypothetical protein [Deltaproteobacteria bacterium]